MRSYFEVLEYPPMNEPQNQPNRVPGFALLSLSLCREWVCLFVCMLSKQRFFSAASLRSSRQHLGGKMGDSSLS